MNFEFMPELHLKYGYFGVLSVMGLIVVLEVIYFKRKKWL
jgi:magnesium transporter